MRIEIAQIREVDLSGRAMIVETERPAIDRKPFQSQSRQASGAVWQKQGQGYVFSVFPASGYISCHRIAKLNNPRSSAKEGKPWPRCSDCLSEAVRADRPAKMTGSGPFPVLNFSNMARRGLACSAFVEILHQNCAGRSATDEAWPSGDRGPSRLSRPVLPPNI